MKRTARTPRPILNDAVLCTCALSSVLISGIGMLLNLKPKMSRWMDQMIMSFGLSVGLGLQITLYCTEVAAVIHCPAASYNATWFQGFRMIDCYKEFNT